jgi:hypothetical protein
MLIRVLPEEPIFQALATTFLQCLVQLDPIGISQTETLRTDSDCMFANRYLLERPDRGDPAVDLIGFTRADPG